MKHNMKKFTNISPIFIGLLFAISTTFILGYLLYLGNM